ncbi:VWA domain-containing protein [Virgibacillus profundi]|nr:VWA domain-containing protein [Virgibacillus profundi]
MRVKMSKINKGKEDVERSEWMFKNSISIIILVFMLFLAACSDENEATSNDDQSNKEDAEVAAEEEKESIVDQMETVIQVETREDMKKQQGGTLATDITLKMELEDSTEEQLNTEIIKELKAEFKKITEETQDPTEIYKGFIYLLGSHHYKDVIKKAEEFEPNFEEPFLPDPGKSEEEVKNEPEKGKAIILLDASSSMLLSVDNKVKMDIAKEAVERFADAIGQDNEVSLVVYGHKGSEADADKELSCNGIEEIYPMGDYEAAAFEESLSTFESKGYTPLAGAIKKAADMSQDFNENVTVYIVSDGVETCDGDPVKEAKNFVKDSEDRTVNIIGFHVDQNAADQLKQVSEAGNGEYYSAESADDIKTTIEKAWLPSSIDLAWAFTKAPDSWEKLAEYERFDENLNQIKDIIQKEKERYDEALQILRDEELVEQEVTDDIRELIYERYNKMMDLMRDFRTEKIDEIDGRAKEIRDRVDKWTEEMRKRKEERGDMF